MVRREDWAKRFSAFLTEHKNEPFKWGKNDCVLFVGKSVEAITGQDFYSQYRYRSESGAQRIIKQNNGIKGLISKALGQPHKNILKARRGDVVLMKLPAVTSGVIDDSGEKIVSVTESGTIKLPLSKAIYVWRV